jgi:hypothetical protein
MLSPLEIMASTLALMQAFLNFMKSIKVLSKSKMIALMAT